MKPYHIIVNPISGRGAGLASVPLIETGMNQRGLEFDLTITDGPGHGIELARQSAQAGYSVVVAVGGDGTINEVVNGLMLAKTNQASACALGVIPVGRGNDFAFGAGIPHDPEEAMNLLKADHRQWIDVGKVSGGLFPNGRYFGNGVGIGFDAVVGFEALKLKKLSGFPSYIVAALKTIFLYYRAPLLQLDLDGKVQTLNSLMVSIMNGRRMGGGFIMAPAGRMDDGYFSLCIVAQVSRRAIFPLILQFMKGTQASHPAVQMVTARQVKVKALQGSLPAHSDGETLCEAGDQLALEIFHQQIAVIGQQGEK